MENLYKISMIIIMLLLSIVIFPQTSGEITGEEDTFLITDVVPDVYNITTNANVYKTETNNEQEVISVAPILISVTPGIEEITLEWEAIPENCKTAHFDFGNKGEHWNVIGNPSGDIWKIFIGSARFDGMDLEAGDEIAIFDNDLAVGAFTLTQVCTPENQLNNNLRAFSLLWGEPGYAAGADFTFIAWDQSENIESVGFEYTFSNPWGDAYTGDVFPPGNSVYSLAELEFTTGVYIPEFNIYYEDGTLVASEVEGTTYTDMFLNAGQEYCYYITQVLEGGIESNPSNELCATPMPQPFGSISGEVTNGVDPIKGAIITVGESVYTVTTGKDGKFFIQDVEPGIYNITASADGYSPETKINQEVFAGETTITDFTLTGIQTYNLGTGYQFVSTRLIPENPDMLNVLENNLNDNLCFVRNTAGSTVRKIGSNWINNIGDWITTEGYLFKMNNDDELIITGLPVDPQTPINLSTGYQMISYLQLQPNNALQLFEGVLDNLDFVRNTSGSMLRKIGPSWVNSIGDIQPGEGYLVKMFVNDVLIYPAIFKTCGDPFSDTRNGQIYNTVLIGDQCWMVENLNIGEMINGTEEMTNNGVIEKYCYNDSSLNCDTYGGLYQWNEMMQYVTDTAEQGICPVSWHLPTDFEWKILEGTVDSQYGVGDPEWDDDGWRGYDVGFNLKSTSGWNDHGNGSGTYGFTAFPGGSRHENGYFEHVGFYAEFWSSSEYNNSKAWHRGLNYGMYQNSRVDRDKERGYSIRCLKNEITIKTIGHPNRQLKMHFEVKDGNPLEPVWIIYFEKGALDQGDEIGVYDGEKLVGACVVVSNSIFENAIPVFSNLYEAGNKLAIKVWDKSENEEYILGDYSFSNPYRDAWMEDVFPYEDGEYSLLYFSTIGISNETMINEILINPNPSEGIFNISIKDNQGNIQLIIINMQGKECRNFKMSENSTQFDLSELNSGIYFVRCIGENFNTVKKVVIK